MINQYVLSIIDVYREDVLALFLFKCKSGALNKYCTIQLIQPSHRIAFNYFK